MELPASYYAPPPATQYGLTAASNDARALGKHDFLKLLVAQLRHQAISAGGDVVPRSGAHRV